MGSEVQEDKIHFPAFPAGNTGKQQGNSLLFADLLRSHKRNRFHLKSG